MNLDKLQTGDLLVLRHLKPGLVLRAIELMGGVTHHDELLRLDGQEIKCLYARHPHTGYIPLRQRICEYDDGKIIFAVYRFHRFCGDDMQCTLQSQNFQRACGASLDTIDICQLPYDWTAVRGIAWNVLRRNLGLFRVLTKQSEHKVFCTELCSIATRIAGENPFEGIPKQDYEAPVHFERVIRAGTWKLVADFGGLHEMITGKNRDR